MKQKAARMTLLGSIFCVAFVLSAATTWRVYACGNNAKGPCTDPSYCPEVNCTDYEGEGFKSYRCVGYNVVFWCVGASEEYDCRETVQDCLVAWCFSESGCDGLLVEPCPDLCPQYKTCGSPAK